MSLDRWILVAVFTATAVLMFGSRLRHDLIAILAALALALTGVIPAQDVLSGLSSSVVLTLIGLFILARGLEETGVIRAAATRLSKVGGSSEWRVLLALMASSAGLSLGMNNVAVGAVLLPASVRVARVCSVAVSRVLLPVAYATLLGGMATYFTTANIVMSDLVVQRGGRPLTMLDFVPTGGLITIAGIAYMLLLGRKLLPGEVDANGGPDGDYFGLYRLGERFWEFHLPRDSPLASRTIGETNMGKRLGVVVLAIRREHRTLLIPGPGIALLPGDTVTVLGREDRVRDLVGWGVDVVPQASSAELRRDLELTEIVVAPRSRVTGRTLAELQLRTKYGVTALALWRAGRIIRTDVGKTPLEVGDGLLVVNLPKRLEKLAQDQDFLVTGGGPAAPSHPRRWALALAIFLSVVVVAFTGGLPIGTVALTGAVAMILTGCVALDDAYRAIDWHVVFLVAGLLPLGFAMVDTGLADAIAGVAGGTLASARPLVVVALMFAVTGAVTQVIGGQVSALLVGPVALSVADVAGVPSHAMAVAVAIGASTAFLTPMAHPVNAMMMGTGGYGKSHFLRVGGGMTLVTLVALLVAMWLLWGLH